MNPFEDSTNLPNPDIIAVEIVEDLLVALAQFAERTTSAGSDRAAQSILVFALAKPTGSTRAAVLCLPTG